MDEFYEDEPMPAFEKKKMSDNASTKATSVTSTNSNTSRNVEDVYQKMTQLEHILARPDTYSIAFFFTFCNRTHSSWFNWKVDTGDVGIRQYTGKAGVQEHHLCIEF